MRVIFFLILLTLQLVLAEESLHAQFSRLRNNDPGFEKPEQWQQLLRGYKGTSLAPIDRYEGAQVAARIAFFNRDSKAFDFAAELLDELLVDHARDLSYLNSAKILRADIALWQEDKEIAARFYTEALSGNDAYQRVVARLRITSLTTGLFDQLKPQPLLEKPLPVTAEERDYRNLRKRKIVILDPGHGGDDTGAIANGHQEKDLVLDIAQRLKQRLNQSNDTRAVLTRRDDYFVPLAFRASLANRSMAQLFVSLHINSTGRGDLRGLETYYLDTTNDQASKRLAERESAGNELAKKEEDLSFIVSDMLQDGKVEESVQFAHTLHARLVRDLKRDYPDLLNLGVKRGPFYVLMGVKVPCILVELLFLDNADDAKLLADKRFRNRISEALAEGVRDYLHGEISKAPIRDSLKAVKAKLTSRELKTIKKGKRKK